MRSDGRALPDLAQTLVLRQLGLIRTDQLPDLAARVNPGRLRRVTLAALPSRLLVPVLAVHEPGPSGLARRRCALEAVEKLVTAPGGRTCRVPLDALHMGSA